MDPVDRMFQVLVRTIRTKHPAYLSAPFTVADVHQQIMPYRHFRRELNLETNQEYEMTLMQLLTGARGYLDVDERLRDVFGKELASSSPEPSRVREFADAQVSLNHAAATAAAGGIPTSATGGAKRTAGPEVSGAAAHPVQSSARCRFCAGELPKGGGRDLHFCPHCGQDLRVAHCPACGAETEEGWKFCVSCGKVIG
jgi:hypothetical protein